MRIYVIFGTIAILLFVLGHILPIQFEYFMAIAGFCVLAFPVVWFLIKNLIGWIYTKFCK